MNPNAEKIVEKIKEVIQRPEVQPGYPDANGNTNTTWCNRAAHAIATELWGDMTPFLHERGIDWTTANMIYLNAEKNADELRLQIAQEAANSGTLVLAACFGKAHGHVAIVCPDTEAYQASRGPLVGEAGASCRIAYSDKAFKKWGYEPRFFIIPRRTL